MLKINKLTRLLSRGVSSGAEYVEDIVQSLDTETKPLQVKYLSLLQISLICVSIGNIQVLF